MRRIHRLRILIIILIFCDFFLFNIRVSFFNITPLRLLILWLTCLLVIKIIKRDVKIPRSKTYIYGIVFFIFWLFYSFIQLLYAQNFEVAIKQIYYLVIFIMMILSFSVDVSKVEWLGYINTFTYIGVLLIYIGIVELITGIHFPQSNYNERIITDLAKATSVFGNENDFGLYLVMVFPLILINKTKVYFGFIKYITSFLLLVLLYFNDSKSALLAIAVMIITYIVLTKHSFYMKLLMTTISLTIMLLFSSKVIEFLSPIYLQLKFNYGSTYVRLNVYKNGLLALKDSLFLGVGPGNFETGIKFYYDTKGIINPHNWWVELATNFGFIIFLLYLIFIIISLRFCLIYYKKSPKENNIMLALFLMIIGFSIGSIGPSSTFYFFHVWFFYGLIMGAIYSQKTTIIKSVV